MSHGTTVLGAILAGGESRRMGRDKALVAVDGIPMATRVATALEAGGADHVVLVGARSEACERLGLANVADRWPRGGPLGAMATVLLDGPDALGIPGASGEVVVVIAGCDQPDLSGEVLARLVHALQAHGPDAMAAAPVAPDGRRHPLPSAWRASAGERLAAAMARGERRADAAWKEGLVVEVAVADAELADLDTPEQVAARSRPDP